MTDALPPEDKDDIAPAPKRIGCLAYALIILIVPILLLMVGFQLWHSNARTQLAAEMDRIKERGEPLWFADLAPERPGPGQDGTGIFLQAIEKLVRPSQAYQDLIGAEPTTPPGHYEAFEVTLNENREALELMREAVRRPYFRLPLDYSTKQPIAILLEPVQQARDFSRLLMAESLLAIGAGDAQRTAAAILDQLLLSEMLRDEPLLITQLVRIAIAAQAVQGLQAALEHLEFTPEQFAAIDDQLALMQSRFRLAPAVIGERAMSLSTIQNLGENVGVAGDGPDGAFALRLLSSGPASPYRMNDQAFMLRIMTQFVDEIDREGPEAAMAMRRAESQIIEAKVGYRHVITTLLTPAVFRCREAGIRHRQLLAHARLGLRVARYYTEHGHYPDKLEAVTDEKLPEVVIDLSSGKPIVYRILLDGFTIYPVGDNGVDDGGEAEPDRQEKGAKIEVHLKRQASPPPQ